MHGVLYTMYVQFKVHHYAEIYMIAQQKYQAISPFIIIFGKPVSQTSILGKLLLGQRCIIG